MFSLIVPLNACTSSTGTPDTTSISSTSKPSTTVVQTDTVSIEEAATRYSEIVRATNCALYEYRDVESRFSLGNAQIDLTGLASLTGAMAKVADARDIAVSALLKETWPQNVQSNIESLELFWASLQRSEVAVSQATDQGTWNSAINLYLNQTSTPEGGLSKIIRMKLMLPDFSESECE